MKLEALNHSHTPAKLREINSKIALVLNSSEELDVKRLNAILEERDKYINAYLLDLSEKNKHTFVNAELVVNNELKQHVQSLLKSAKNDAARFVRNRALAKKYK